MKKLLILAITLLPLTSLAQQSEWTDKELRVIETFDLQTNDIRGVIFTKDDYACDIEVKSEKEAILAFFQPEIRKDLTRICVKEFDDEFVDRVLGIHDVVKLYLLKTDKK